MCIAADYLGKYKCENLCSGRNEVLLMKQLTVIIFFKRYDIIYVTSMLVPKYWVMSPANKEKAMNSTLIKS